MYLGTDAIADRDLGFAIACRAHPSGAVSTLAARTETWTSPLISSQGNVSGTVVAPSTIQQGRNKRAVSHPEHRKHDESSTGGVQGDGLGKYSLGHKRARQQSPARDREMRWGRRDLPTAPSWDRGGRGRDGPCTGKGFEENKGHHVQLPGMVSWFIGELPTPALFDGTAWIYVLF